MSPIPSLKYTEVIKFLSSLGYIKVRQKGSHIRFECHNRVSITVPTHNPITRGVLRKILRDCGETVENLKDFLGIE